MKKINKLFVTVMALTMASSTFLGACMSTGGNSSSAGNAGNSSVGGATSGSAGGVVDAKKTQLNVWCVNSGYKRAWIDAAIADYEEINKDRSFETGKKGVKVVLDAPKQFPSFTEVKGDKINEVYIMEHVAYRNFYENRVFADISDGITKANPYDEDGRTILSRMSTQQQSALSIDGKYYSVPHFYGNYGLVYNADLFDENGWYFDAEGKIIETRTNATKSSGPNGKAGDYDDGLPATYEQFFQLCDKIVEYQMTPVCWTGTSYHNHFTGLLNCLVADYEGYDNMIERLNFNGEQTLATVAKNGNLIMDSQPTKITDENGYEVFRQAGIYYGLSFVEKLIKTDVYHNKDAFNDYSNLQAQKDFIRAGKDGVTGEIAMLLDGDWWLQEASESFETYKQYGTQYERNFKWMPLPKATAAKIGEKATDYDDTNGYAFVNANTADSKKAIAIDFIQFLNSEEQLVQYSKITNTLRPLDYNMSEADLNELTPFGRSLFEHKKADNTDKVLFMSSSETFSAIQTALNEPYQAKFGGISYGVGRAFHEVSKTGATAANYFSNLYDYWKKDIFAQ